MKITLVLFALLSIGIAQHGQDVKCTRWCAPAGHEDHAEPPDGIQVVTCANQRTDGCQSESGEQCRDKHRSGCTENCRAHCCQCCPEI